MRFSDHVLNDIMHTRRRPSVLLFELVDKNEQRVFEKAVLVVIDVICLRLLGVLTEHWLKERIEQERFTCPWGSKKYPCSTSFLSALNSVGQPVHVMFELGFLITEHVTHVFIEVRGVLLDDVSCCTVRRDWGIFQCVCREQIFRWAELIDPPFCRIELGVCCGIKNDCVLRQHVWAIHAVITHKVINTRLVDRREL